MQVELIVGEWPVTGQIMVDIIDYFTPCDGIDSTQAVLPLPQR
jgi:hypothetical protein